MQGSLDQPPIIIRKSRVKSLLMLFVSAALSFGSILLWRDGPDTPRAWMALPGVFLFGLGVPLFGWELFRPDRLLLSPSGLEWRTVRKTLRYSWEQLSGFSVFSVRGSKMIGFSVTGSNAPPKLLARFNSALTGNSAALSGLWEIKPENVAELLNSARAKWRSTSPEAGHDATVARP